MNTPPTPRPIRARPLGVPSRRAVGALVAGALALGVLAGASLAPAPPTSLASSSTIVTRLLSLLAAEDGGARTSSTPSTAPATPTPSRHGAAHARVRRAAATAASKPTGATSGNAATGAGESSASEGNPSGGQEKGGGKGKPARLPPISHVWLVILNGQGFAQASTAPASYPYLTGALLKAGSLLERYSAIEAYELAGDAALLTGGVGESVSTISEPTGETPGAGGQAEADDFLQRTVAPILASTAYAQNGLIVVSFGSSAQETTPPALSATTLSSTPAGALLLSPVLKAGSHSAEAFDSLAPRQSLEAIFAAS